MTRRRLTPGRRAALFVAVAVVWAIQRAGVGDRIVNGRGWPNFTEFWTSVTSPELGADFLRLTVEAAGVTVGFAVLGTLLSLVIGALGALMLSELLWPKPALRNLARLVFIVPRAVHEVVWAILLLQIFGFDPIVAIVAIGLPFGAITARVFADTIDEAPTDPYHRLRSSGATRLTALAYGVLPAIRGELASYAFYRLECAIRAAAVLGVLGAGGIGFQIDLSFESLRYEEIWTLIAALMILSGIADWWSTTVRRSTGPAVTRWSILAGALLVPLSIRWVGFDLSTLWNGRWSEFAGDLIGDLLRPSVGPRGWSGYLDATIDTVAMSIIAAAFAVPLALLAAMWAARSTGRTDRTSPLGTVRRRLVALLLLLARAVPAPVWAFLMVLVLFPGPWPGAIALGVYNVGVIGRLFAEVLEETPSVASDALRASGATATAAVVYGRVFPALGRLTSIALYRWEVIARETVVVGVVGAGGLGQLIREHLAARNFPAVSGSILALIVVALVIDVISTTARRAVRRGVPEREPPSTAPPDSTPTSPSSGPGSTNPIPVPSSALPSRS
ncbi:MAG: PhnE/PtxC family ABC transporter permease [Ilumatobacter sp.]|uniref:PhnE/PtxC family ABC transporter permease n=1 Tax=Ilumatobacter sp. TaxID=1967498 RepID=UPI00391A4CE8